MPTPWNWSPTLALASFKSSRRTRFLKYVSTLDLRKAHCWLRPFFHSAAPQGILWDALVGGVLER
eukprot:966842-Alexandrium_andersonii.AAC.1